MSSSACGRDSISAGALISGSRVVTLFSPSSAAIGPKAQFSIGTRDCRPVKKIDRQRFVQGQALGFASLRRFGQLAHSLGRVVGQSKRRQREDLLYANAAIADLALS